MVIGRPLRLFRVVDEPPVGLAHADLLQVNSGRRTRPP